MRHLVRHVKRSERKIRELEERIELLEARPVPPQVFFTYSRYPPLSPTVLTPQPLIPQPPVVVATDSTLSRPLRYNEIDTVPPSLSGYIQTNPDWYDTPWPSRPDDDDGAAGVPAKV